MYTSHKANKRNISLIKDNSQLNFETYDRIVNNMSTNSLHFESVYHHIGDSIKSLSIKKKFQLSIFCENYIFKIMMLK